MERSIAYGFDTLPQKETECQIHSILLTRNQSFTVRDQATNSFVTIRRANNLRVYVDRNGEPPTNQRIPMVDNEITPIEVEGKVVKIKPIEFVEGRRRKFEVSLDDGLVIE